VYEAHQLMYIRNQHLTKETVMKRKSMAPRNPFVAAAKFRKAGAHGKTGKASRRADKMELRDVAQRQSIRLLTDRREFNSLHPDQRNIEKSIDTSDLDSDNASVNVLKIN